MEAIDIARRVVEAASDKQAIDIVLLDTRDVCSFAEYFVICSGDSSRQIDAIREEIEHVLKEQGVRPHHYEGSTDSGWLLMDYGAVIIHIFAPEERDYYQLDKLWGQANTLVRVQ
ncbi:MAG: ribosome silencing factor [Chloroflexi bacterium]|nr:ribosome silencing factor [Chloroflexota bacterium]